MLHLSCRFLVRTGLSTTTSILEPTDMRCQLLRFMTSLERYVYIMGLLMQICCYVYSKNLLLQDNKDIWKFVLGKHNLTVPISSYSQPEVVTKSQSYFFSHSVKEIAVTSTAMGITSKQLLIGTSGDQVC